MDFQVDGKKVVMHFNTHDIYANTANYRDHREYINETFRRHGYVITKWNWGKDPDSSKWIKNEDGITFMAADTLVDLRIEIHGELGKNVRQVDAAGN